MCHVPLDAAVFKAMFAVSVLTIAVPRIVLIVVTPKLSVTRVTRHPSTSMPPSARLMSATESMDSVAQASCSVGPRLLPYRPVMSIHNP
jgi:hypothetical protein